MGACMEAETDAGMDGENDIISAVSAQGSSG